MKRLKLFSFIEWCLWNAEDDMTNFQRNFSTGEVEIAGSVIYHKTEFKERRNHYAFFSVIFLIQGYDTDRESFLGLYNGFDAPEVNTAGEDWSTGDFFQSISDQSEGYEAQLIFTPNDNLQIVLNYSHVEREVISPGNFASFDYAAGNWDRWAMWYFPNSNWGLAGVPVDLVYPGGPSEGLPSEDTSDWSGVGWGKGEALDDTPADTVSAWAHYKFDEGASLGGLEIGLGLEWQSGREYASAFTSAGQRKQNQNEEGVSIKAVTDSRYTINGMVKYSWRAFHPSDPFMQLNVDNLLDDQDQYGFVYAPGISLKFNLGMSF